MRGPVDECIECTATYSVPIDIDLLGGAGALLIGGVLLVGTLHRLGVILGAVMRRR